MIVTTSVRIALTADASLMESIKQGRPEHTSVAVQLTDGVANTDLDEASNNSNGQALAEEDAEMIRDFLWNGGTSTYTVWECAIGADSAAHASCGINTYDVDFGGGAHLWTVYFGEDDSNQDWLESLVDLEGNLGEAKNTTNADDLVQIYEDIAASIPVVIAK